MFVPNKSFSGPYLLPHGPAIAEIIARRGVQTVLDIGCAGVQNSVRIAVAPQWWGLAALAGNADPGLSELPAGARYDLVIATHWLSTLPLTAVEAGIDVLHHLSGGAIYVVEPIVAATIPPTGRGLDRAEWIRLLGRGNNTEITLASKLRLPSSIVAITRLRSTGQRQWQAI